MFEIPVTWYILKCSQITVSPNSQMCERGFKDKAWFNEDCKRANLAKQEAYQLWRKNCSDITWNNWVNLRNATQETYVATEKEYNESVRDTLIGITNSHKWLSTLRIMDLLHIALRRRQSFLLMCLVVNRVTIVLLCHSHVFLRLN